MGEEARKTGRITGGEEAGRFDACEEAEGGSHGAMGVGMLEWKHRKVTVSDLKRPDGAWGCSRSGMRSGMGA